MPGRSAFGTVRERTNGTWQARWQDKDGHQHTATRATKAEANDWLADQNVDRRRGVWTDERAGRTTFDAWQAQWRTTIVDLRPSTLARDLNYVDNYLLPTLGPLQLSDIDYLKVTALVAELTAKGLYPATVVKAKQILSKILRAAVRAKLIPANPADDIKLPRIQRKEITVLDEDQIHDLADSIDERYRGLVYLGCYGGLRIGELLYLKAGQVDVDRRQARVTEIVVDVAGHLVVNATKTRAGTRTVPLPRLVLDELQPHLDDKLPGALLFPAPKGGITRYPNWLKRQWKDAFVGVDEDGREVAKLPFRVTPHAMRHTAVSMWIASGATPSECATWGGHESVSTILDVYGHLFAGLEGRVMDRLDERGSRRLKLVQPRNVVN